MLGAECWESLVARNASRAALMLHGCVSRDAEDVPAMLGSPSVRHDGAQHGAAGKRWPASLEHDLNAPAAITCACKLLEIIAGR